MKIVVRILRLKTGLRIYDLDDQYGPWKINTKHPQSEVLELKMASKRIGIFEAEVDKETGALQSVGARVEGKTLSERLRFLPKLNGGQR